MEFIDAISSAGLGKFVLAFLPTGMNILLFDIIIYAVLPIVVLLGMTGFARKKAQKKINKKNAWNECGRFWIMTGAAFVVFHIVLYFGYVKILQVTISDLRSLQQQYREEVLGATSADDNQNIADFIKKYQRNKAENETPAPAEQTSKNDQSDWFSSDNTPVISAVNSAAERIVSLFYYKYPWLHHILYVLVWLCVTAWFFLPGVKMSTEKTVINVTGENNTNSEK